MLFGSVHKVALMLLLFTFARPVWRPHFKSRLGPENLCLYVTIELCWPKLEVVYEDTFTCCICTDIKLGSFLPRQVGSSVTLQTPSAMKANGFVVH